jgi:hypothetical protein
VQQSRLSLRQILARDVGDGVTAVWQSRAGATAGSSPADADTP